MLKLVPTVKTTPTEYELTRSFISEWFKTYLQWPKKENIATLYGQYGIESGLKFAFCWNLGNVKAVDIPGQTIEYCMLANVFEYINGKKVVFQPPSPQTFFRAFPTLETGTAFYFNFLRNNRYKTAWESVVVGDPKEFVHRLKMQGYFTASESAYLNGLMSYYNLFMKSTSFEKALAELQQSPPTTTLQPTPQPNTTEPSQPDTNSLPMPQPSPQGFWQLIAAFFSWLFSFKKK